MQYSLGIDAGGTFTDAVIIRDSDGAIVGSTKVLTTYPNPIGGIKKAIDELDPEYVRSVKLVSVSTTLSTNTILEDTGFPVGVILVGDYVIPEEGFPAKYYVRLNGGHTSNGEEAAPLDEEGVRKFAIEIKDQVSAFAVSSFFSNRNSEHELRVKHIIKELTGLPVVCGHELSQEVGAYDRSITAYLNAQLLPITHRFIKSIMQDISSRGIDANLLMLKCDGSVVSMEEALERPIESIFSGPAASLVGAAYLTKYDTCAMVDVGGTSTDVALIRNGIPELSDQGAVVGGWKTMVKAIRMETSATGGDSHIWTQDQRFYVGPRRVIPLCRAAVEYTGFLAKLGECKNPSRKLLCENVQPSKFFVRTGFLPMDLSRTEEEVYDAIQGMPVSYTELFLRLKKQPSVRALDSLIQKRLIQAIGFTPTDALHVLGDFQMWDAEASVLGAEKLARFMNMKKEELCNEIKRKVAWNMASDLVSYLVAGIPESVVEKMLSGENFTRFKIETPVVLLGGPVVAFKEEMEKLIDTDIVLPEYASVGNAVGALVGKGIKRVEILVKRDFSPITGENVTNEELKNTKELVRYFVFASGGRQMFSEYLEAVDFATTTAKQVVMDYMKSAGYSESEVDLEVTRKELSIRENEEPVETKVIVVGVGTSKIVVEKDVIPDYMRKKALSSRKAAEHSYSGK
ncbi:hydantoinase/oxoprolinase family protein [Methanolobus halotolerans]|uniref:Hydantoinase n=1 Tax=Methanolobus halotolerans TaxID=2052935 RepID=A0A4E0QTZ3_9EURY|nr:hydantoinase/oxoprolinase family protein [Methanolobus halotolerans]TGC11495.1 hydantoinase [Methanolobus halotolerans]